MKKFYQALFLYFVFPLEVFSQQTFKTKFELSEGTETVTYHEGITYFKKLAGSYKQIEIQEYGPTDSGYPLHLVVFSADQDFDFQSLKKKKKYIILINNAIHPGEPDGVDASMMLVRDLVQDKKLMSEFKDIVLAIIPFYNIGGVLNRNSTTRVNQNGPVAYGFRGNAQNLDLNRDFIKADSKNALSFAHIFHSVDPDIFIDTHVSNGADYQHVMTMIETQPDKLGGALGNYLKHKMMPKLEAAMSAKGWDMVPYVNVYDTIPDVGYDQFLDLPRYSSGFTTLFQTLGFVPETHMLKPYKQRVRATYDFLKIMMNALNEEGKIIRSLRLEAKNAVKTQKDFEISWQLDRTHYQPLVFKGFEANYATSKVTGQKRLYYDRSSPFTKNIPFYNNYVASKKVKKPVAYIIPKGWHRVIERLRSNNVALEAFENDTSLTVEVYRIASFKTVGEPYEGHYLHYDTKVESEIADVEILKGDFIVYANQTANRYIVETLEPEAPDSFFNWNFFDTILQQKEDYSDYVFEDLAYEILQTNPELKEDFEAKKAREPEFVKDGQAQLDYIYKRSPYHEKVYRRYPVFRIL